MSDWKKTSVDMDDWKKLIGKKIIGICIKGHSEYCDSLNVLELTMSDGTIFEIEGGYGSFTGHSCDEYIEKIEVRKVK